MHEIVIYVRIRRKLCIIEVIANCYALESSLSFALIIGMYIEEFQLNNNIPV